MRRILILALVLSPFLSFCQVGYIGTFNNGPNMTTDRYVMGSGPTIPLCYGIEQVRDSSWIKFKSKQVIIPYLSNGTGSPNYIYTDVSGTLINASPSWYTQTQSDGRYLQSFTELDPVFSASFAHGITNSNISQWTNNANYLTSFTETDPLFATKFAAQNTSGLSEGSNLYYTATRFNSAFSGKATTDLAEGTNLYYTSTRWNTAFGAASTSGLSEGTNLYYTQTRFNTAFGAKTTDGLGEGTVNVYYTNTRARASIVFTTTGTGASSYNTTTGALNIPTPPTPNTVTINSGITRPVNSTTYTVSTTNNARVYYTIDISCTASIGSASTGDVLLQYSTNGGSTYVSVGELKNSNTVTLAIVLNSVTVQRGVIAAEIPANALCRLVSTVAGTTTITYITGQETTY